jgi:AcrR family transcriptional regulator
MWYMSAARDPRSALVERAIDHLAEHGTTDLTLRGLAAGLGTSHRMLIYHFGSKDGLLVAVAREMERRQLAALAALREVPGADAGQVMRGMYRHLHDPALAPYMRLFFELYGRALRADEATRPMLAGVVESWLEPLVEFVTAAGVPPDEAAADARLCLAVARGLALDWLATGDDAALDAAAERFFTGLEQRWRDADRN